MADVTQWMQYLVNGVSLGAILALAAIGLTLVYGILNLANFAHGDTLTLGAYTAFFFGVGSWWGRDNLVTFALVAAALLVALPLADRFARRWLSEGERRTMVAFGLVIGLVAGFIAIMGDAGGGTTNRVLLLGTLLAVLVVVTISVALELVMWRPLRRRKSTILSLVIASLGLSLVIRAGLQIYFGGDFRSLARPLNPAPTYFGVSISDAQVLTLIVAVSLIVLVHVLLTYTRIGKAMRALADNRDLARVCGIDVDRVIVYVWAIGGALVAVGGVMLTLIQNHNVNINMGFSFLIPIFAAVVVGGVGSPYGAMLGGLVVGIGMRLGPAVVGLGAEWDLAAAFVLLIAVLVLRPQGIFGRATR